MNCKTVLLKDLVLGEKGSYGIGAPAVDYDPKKYTYLRITDINDDGSINTNGLKSVDAEDAYKYVLQENDIVFARLPNAKNVKINGAKVVIRDNKAKVSLFYNALFKIGFIY